MKQYLVDLIKINGPISISAFMNEALFNQKYGYYTNSKPIGKEGDFITSPEISQTFGELIGAYLVNLWQNNYESQEISLVEMGAGKGTLIKDLLRFASKIPNFLDKVSINIVEISPKLQKIQKECLKNHKINWHNDFIAFKEQNKNKPIFFISNELFDCFAINQYVKIDGFWVERLVGLSKNEELLFVLGNKNEAINKKISQLTNNKGRSGDVFEHSPASDEFMSILSKSIKGTKGIALIIDYGCFTCNNFNDTLQALKNHKYSNIFKDLGQSDITAHVNFAYLKEIAQKENLQTWLINQKEFLESLGIEIRRKNLIKDKSTKEQDLINSSINRLIDKDQMGELFKVLILST